jgi:uncharacterized protein
MTLATLLNPAILFFLLGLVAGLVKSSLRLPEGLSKTLSLYLMIAIGLRGGVELSHVGLGGSALLAVGVALLLSLGLPVVAHNLLRLTTSLDRQERASIAAHYGSVSVVTFAAAIAMLQRESRVFEPYMIGLLAVMEAPAIVSGLTLARRAQEPGATPPGSLGAQLVQHVFLHGGIVLLLGSFTIGWLIGPSGLRELEGAFVTPFQGVLCVFLLDMGLMVADRVADLKKLRPSVMAFGVYMPLVGAALGLLAGRVLGLSTGGMTLLAVLAASASYIVVPAVMRTAIPSASPAISLSLALGITFPFNVTVGIPLYAAAASALSVPAARQHDALEHAAARAVVRTRPASSSTAAEMSSARPEVAVRVSGLGR